mgnify:CR=1 FL=1
MITDKVGNKSYLGIEINYDKESKLDKFSLDTLKDRYLWEKESHAQEAFARASVFGATYKGETDFDLAQRLYQYSSDCWFMFSTPILSNGGTTRGLPISCFLNYVPDSRRGLSDHYDIVKTGISHPIIITSMSGMVEPGDEIAAYANGEVVGATKILDPDGVTLISASGGYNQYGLELPGYMEGDEIELRVYRHTTGEELYVSSNLEGSYYGMTPLTSGDITVHEVSAVPEDYILSQNYPNPFNPSTHIEFSVPVSGDVRLSIYDITGRLVQDLLDGTVSEGYHSVLWDGRDRSGQFVSAGLYIYSLTTENSTLTRKMVIMK